MNAYQVIDRCLEALRIIDKARFRKTTKERLFMALDIYQESQQWFLEHNMHPTFIDLRERAQFLMTAQPELFKFDEEMWVYYANRMPMPTNLIETLISENHALNSVFTTSALQSETKTDPYLARDYAAQLIAYKDYTNWARYITERRHDKFSKAQGLLSLSRIDINDSGHVLGVLKELLVDHPWHEQAETRNLSLREPSEYDTLYHLLHLCEKTSIIENIFHNERYKPSAQRMSRLHHDYDIGFNASWRQKQIQDLYASKYLEMPDDQKMGVAVTAFCFGTDAKAILSTLDEQNIPMCRQLLHGLSLLKQHEPQIYQAADTDLAQKIVEQILSKKGMKALKSTDLPIDSEIYSCVNLYKRQCLSEDLGI